LIVSSSRGFLVQVVKKPSGCNHNFAFFQKRPALCPSTIREQHVMSKDLKKWLPYVFGFFFIAGVVVASIYYVFVK